MGTDPYGDNAPERMTELEKIIGDQMMSVTDKPDRRFSRPPHWPDLSMFDPSEFKQEPMKRVVSSTLPFALFINEQRFAEGIATIDNGELQFHLEGMRELELMIADGMFDGVRMNVTFEPAYPATQKVTVDSEREHQNKILRTLAGIKEDDTDV
jgi:hypothetical protein